MSSQSFASDNCQIINFNLSNRNLHKCRVESEEKSAKNSVERVRERGRKTEGRTLLSMMNKTKIVIGLKGGRQAGAGDGDDGQGKTMSAKMAKELHRFQSNKDTTTDTHVHTHTHTDTNTDTHSYSYSYNYS